MGLRVRIFCISFRGMTRDTACQREKPPATLRSSPSTWNHLIPTSHLKSLLKAEGRSGAQGEVCRMQGRLQLPSTALELPWDWDKQECVLHLVLLWTVLVSMNTGLTKEPMACLFYTLLLWASAGVRVAVMQGGSASSCTSSSKVTISI